MATAGEKAAQKGCKYFRMELYTCGDAADSFFLFGHADYLSQLLDFNWLEQFENSQNTALQVADVFLTPVGQCETVEK